MAHETSTETCRRLATLAEDETLVRRRRITRYDAGDTLELDLTGVVPAWKGRARFELEKYVGGGFAGQVYRAKLLDLETETDDVPLDVGGVYAVKIFVPWSGFGRMFRNAVYAIGFQAPFGLQVNPDAVRAAALWQKVIRRGAELKFGRADAVVDVHATFHEPGLGSMGEVLEWVDGRVWRLEVDEHALDDDAERQETEYAAKRRFMRGMVELFHEVGAPEFARQYEWWTMKSQPNVLKRRGHEEGPAAGLTAVDFGAGLALLPFLPMSPGDVKLIFKGLGRGRLVQFDRGDLDRLDTFVAEHPELFTGMGGAMAELHQAERAYHRSQLDLTHHHFRLVTDGALRRQVREGFVRSWENRGRMDRETAERFRNRPGRTWLYVLIGLVPILGRLVQRLWGSAEYRRHVWRLLTGWSYFKRTMGAKQAEILIDWHRAGRVTEAKVDHLLAHPVRFWLQAYTLGLLPAGLHHFLTDKAFAWDVFRYVALRPVKLYMDTAYRRQWLVDMVEEGREQGMLKADEARHILGRVDEPYIQRYLKCLAVHVCTLPITQVVSVIVAVVYLLVTDLPFSEAWAWALLILGAFQVTPISPGSLTRGGYVVYMMVREKKWYEYRLASMISFWKYIGYLGFPIQMASSYPVLARFMAARWATGAVGLVPVFGERGALLEHGVFHVFFNVPISLRRRWDAWTGRDRFLAWIGSFGPVGWIPGAPGTYGSLAAAGILLGLWHVDLAWWGLFIAIFPLVAIGIAAAAGTERHLGKKDPGAFVVDEVVGMAIAGLAAWAPGFLAMVARQIERDAYAWSAIGRGAWHEPLAAYLPGATYAWATLAIGFVWFRLFDIAKPPPVRQMEKLHGGWGVMMDDIFAGILALAATVLTVLALNAWA